MDWSLYKWPSDRIPFFEHLGIRVYMLSGPNNAGYYGLFVSRDELIRAFEGVLRKTEVPELVAQKVMSIIFEIEMCDDFAEVLERIVDASQDEEVPRPIELRVRENDLGQKFAVIIGPGYDSEPYFSLHRLVGVVAGQFSLGDRGSETAEESLRPLWAIVARAQRLGLPPEAPWEHRWIDRLMDPPRVLDCETLVMSADGAIE